MLNEFNKTMPADVAAKIKEHLDAIRTLGAPYLTPRTAKQRKTMLRMGDKTVAFVQKASEYATNNPNFVPAFVDVQELQQDVAGVTTLTPLRQQLQQLTTDFDSTIMVAGGESYGNSLTFYTNVKFLAKNNQPGAQAALDDLKVRFAGQGTPKPDKPTE